MAGQVILIVDDNASNRKLTREVPDLVLIDIRMPDLSVPRPGARLPAGVR